MAAFCTKCGAALTSGAFCTACGAPVAPPAAVPVAPAPVAVAPAAPQGGSNVVKIVLIVVGIIVFFMIAAMGSCIYLGYRARKGIEALTQAPGSSSVYSGKKDACSLISASQVSEALGQPAEMVPESSSASMCHFKYGAEGNTVDVTFNWKGGAMLMKLLHTAMEHTDKGEKYEMVDNLGDEACQGPGGELMMRKGDVMVNIASRPANAEAAKKIASHIAERL